MLLQTQSDSLNSISFKRNGELKQNPNRFDFTQRQKKLNKLASSVY